MAGNLPLSPNQVPNHNDLNGANDPNAHHEKFTAQDHAQIDHTGLPGIPNTLLVGGYDPATEELFVKYAFRYGDFDVDGQFWHGFHISDTYIRRVQARIGYPSTILTDASPISNLDVRHRIANDSVYVVAVRFINGVWNEVGYEYATSSPISLQVGAYGETGNPRQGFFIVVNGTIDIDSNSSDKANIAITKTPGYVFFGHYSYEDDTTNHVVEYNDIIAANNPILQMSLLAVYDKP